MKNFIKITTRTRTKKQEQNKRETIYIEVKPNS